MGKMPPSMRGAQLPVVSNLMKNQLQQSSQTPPVKPFYPHYKNKSKPPPPKKTPSRNHPTSSFKFPTPHLSDAKSIFNSLISTSNSSPILNLHFYNSILHSFSAISTPGDSIGFLNYMIKAASPNFTPDRSTYHILISHSASSLDSVRKSLNVMLSHGFPPDKVTADIATRALCNSSPEPLLEEAVELVKELSGKHSLPDTYTFNFLVKQLCRNRSLTAVNSFINDMKDGFGVKPDLVTYTILIDNVCNTKNLREATRLLGVLSDQGFKPDCYVYNTIMKGYCMLSQGGEVLRVYKKMEEEGVKPDIVTFNTLIFGLSKSGRVKDAKKFLGVMTEAGHFPDAVTYTSLMNGMCREGNALGALNLLVEMEDKGCTPNSCTYNTLLHGLCKARLLDKGIDLFGVMKDSDMKLETGSYGTFVRALCRNGRVAEAYQVFDYAVESKSLTDVSAYATLEATLKWLKKAKEQGLAV